MMLQKVALALVGVGGLAVIGWLARAFFTSSAVPLVLRIAIGAVGAGVLILIGVAVKDRLIQSKNEDFKGVDR